MISCVILEDNEADMTALKQMLVTDPRFHLKSSVANIKQLKDVLSSSNVDLILADVVLGEDSLLNAIPKLPYKPEIIIVSAYPQYALPAFAQEALHYITKPIKKEYLNTALERAYRKISFKSPQNNYTFFFLQTGKNKFNRIEFNELIMVEADGEYLKLHLTDNREVVVFKRLKLLLQELPVSLFKQVHRSYIVNIDFIESIDAYQITMKNRRVVNVGKTFKPVIIDLLNLNSNKL